MSEYQGYEPPMSRRKHRPTFQEKVVEIGWEDLVSTKRTPFALVDRLLYWSSVNEQWMMRSEAGYDPEKKRALRHAVLRRATWGALFAFLVIGHELADNFGPIVYTVWMTARGLLLGTIVAHYVLFPTWKKMSYGSGWRRGRMEYRDSMREAQARGMSFEEWYTRELLHDLRTMRDE